jgi:hypothetical protein
MSRSTYTRRAENVRLAAIAAAVALVLLFVAVATVAGMAQSLAGEDCRTSGSALCGLGVTP